MQVFEVLTGVIVILLTYTIIAYLRQLLKNLPPGPLGLPLVGYLPFLDAKHPHESLTKLAEKYGRIYSLQMGRIFTVVLSDVKLVRQALALDCFSGRAPLYLTHGIMKGNGIICVQGDKWKEQRKFVVSCLRNLGMVKFGKKREKMENDILTGIEEMVNKIKIVDGKPIDLEDCLMHSLGNVVFNLVFGKTWRENDDTWKKLINLQKEGTKLIGVAGPINFLPLLRFLPKYKRIISYIENGIVYSHNIYQDILKEHKAKRAADMTVEGQSFYGEDAHFLGAFDREMTKRQNEESFYTPEQFNYLMADIWGAGVDTTMTTLRWFFLYMASYPEFQLNIHKELDDILNNRKLTLADVPLLPYLQACISEVQRIRSVTPLGIPHGTLEATTLDGYYIPKGTMIVPLQWAIHMSKTNHKNPNTYDPSRFLDDNGKYVKPEAFIPFQTGKRICLGEEYARMLLFLYGGTALQNFCVSLNGDADLEGDVGITLTPKHHELIFTARK